MVSEWRRITSKSESYSSRVEEIPHKSDLHRNNRSYGTWQFRKERARLSVCGSDSCHTRRAETTCYLLTKKTALYGRNYAPTRKLGIQESVAIRIRHAALLVFLVGAEEVRTLEVWELVKSGVTVCAVEWNGVGTQRGNRRIMKLVVHSEGIGGLVPFGARSYTIMFGDKKHPRYRIHRK